MKAGIEFLENKKCRFRIWSPFSKSVDLKIVKPYQMTFPLNKIGNDYWETELDNISEDTCYFYRLNNSKDRPDPVSNFQPEGVHQYSQVINHKNFKWDDEDWKNINFSEMILYEIHVGTFSEKGTFEEIIPKLDYIKSIGINAIEIMPVAQFPGNRNWGYDGTYHYAVQNTYGAVKGFKNLINECHKKEIAVILDVVYNHFGPEGNYSGNFAPYLTNKYKTPWGQAVNFDSENSHGVRDYVLNNVIYWFENFHIDGLRLDAIHSICDNSEKHILQEISEVTLEYSKKTGKEHFLIAESDLNDIKVMKPFSKGGYNMNAQWTDDFHHSIRTSITGEKQGYFCDFGKIEYVEKSLKKAFVYTGQYSEYREKNHGKDPENTIPEKFLVYSQNHDQIGNSLFGKKPYKLNELKLAAGITLLSPYTPMLFMGEEYGEDNPFNYFISHSDSYLIQAVRQGRKKEFEFSNLIGDPPDPQNENTFLESKLDWNKVEKEPYKNILSFYKEIIRLRIKYLDFFRQNENVIKIISDKIIFFNSVNNEKNILMLFNFSDNETKFNIENSKKLNWKKVFDSENKMFKGQKELLPDNLSSNLEYIIPEYSFAVFEI